MSLQFPPSPSTGQTFPSPLIPGQPSWVWDSQKWTSRGLADAMVSTSPLPPLNPRVGDLWFDPVEGNTYLYFDDGNSQQWVVTINQTTSFATLPYAFGYLADNVSVAANVYGDGPSVDVGREGMWFVVGTVSWYGAESAYIAARLWDGITVISSCFATGSIQVTPLTCSGIAINPQGPVKISVLSNSGGVITNTNGSAGMSNGRDSHITAVRIA